MSTTHRIPADGGAAEILTLTQAHQTGALSPAKRLRLAALTWQPDATMERVALIAETYPDLAGIVPSELTAGLPRYLATRAAAKAAGRSVAEPPAELVAELATAAIEIRATAGIPVPSVEGRAIDRRNREAFGSAVRAGDFGAVVTAWTAWLGEIVAFDSLLNRHSAARAAFGRGAGAFASRPRPAFLRELEQALGGSSSISTFGPSEAGIAAPGR